MDSELEQLLRHIDLLSPEAQREVLASLSHLEEAESTAQARVSFLAFVKKMWPEFKESAHNRHIAKIFEDVVRGVKRRVIINIRPRVGKSEFASVFLPAWYIGQYPTKKIMQITHTANLSQVFGRRVRDLITTPEYQAVFPGVLLKPDTKAAGRWWTTRGGQYFAAGVDSNIAGYGSDLCIVDDPHSEQSGKTGDRKVFDQAYEWYTKGPRQRLQPGGAICVVMTRWHKSDLTGRLLKAEVEDSNADKWEHVEFPAILESGKVLFPELWPKEEVLRQKASMPLAHWNAQYQQNPSAEEASLVKREWWQIWPHETPPPCEFKIMTWDTAMTKTETADYSAMTVWGVFYKENEAGKMVPNIILLEALAERLEFPELKKLAFKKWKHHEPDAFLVEAKASGQPLVFELRSMGIPVSEAKVSRGSTASPNAKFARVSGIADLFSSKMVWRPDKKWAEAVSEQFAEFPSGDHDDLVDAATIALTRFRQGGFMRLPDDEEPEDRRSFRKRRFYW